MILLWFLTGCGGAPPDSLTWRESWEVLIAAEDGSIVDARATVGNSGMLRGEGRLYIDRWAISETPILYGVEGGPNDIDISDAHDSVRIGSALVGRFEDGEHWSIRAASENANAILRIDPGGPVPPMVTALVGGGQWTVTAPITRGVVHGWYTAGKRGGLIKGRAVALHRGGDGQPEGPRRAVYLLGVEASLGLDQQGDLRLAWANIGGEDFDLSEAALIYSADGSLRLDLRPEVDLWVSVEVQDAGGQRDGHEHLLPPERWIARAWNRGAMRTVRRAWATVHLRGKELKSPAIVLTVE